MSAAERRREIIAAAATAFAHGGYAGTSTEEIARRAGISQPYLFRLFATKKELFLAAAGVGFDRVTDAFLAAADGLEGPAALGAMGFAYLELVADRDLLLLQLHTYAATADPEIRAYAGERFSDLITVVRDRTGVSYEEIRAFFATGMLLNVVAALGLEDFAELCPPGLFVRG